MRSIRAEEPWMRAEGVVQNINSFPVPLDCLAVDLFHAGERPKMIARFLRPVHGEPSRQLPFLWKGQGVAPLAIDKRDVQPRRGNLRLKLVSQRNETVALMNRQEPLVDKKESACKPAHERHRRMKTGAQQDQR